MDFSKAPRSISPHFPAKHGAPTDEDVPAGADFWVWDQTIGPAEGNGTGRSAPNPMSPSQPDPMPSLLASTLNWSVSISSEAEETRHPQVQIKVGQTLISVDREMAELIQLLNSARIYTTTSCIGTQETWGYVMIAGLDSIVRFVQFWNRYLGSIGRAVPTLQLDARDSVWRDEIGSEYPFPMGGVPVDREGLTYTALWREHRDALARLMPELLWALRCHLRAPGADCMDPLLKPEEIPRMLVVDSTGQGGALRR